MNDFDLKCYTKIIEFLEKGSYSRRELIISVCRTLLTLMRLLKEGKNKEIISNGINLAISYLKSSSPHTYNSIGIDFKHVDEEDKLSIFQQLKALLRYEFLPH